eukprot:388508-Amphidinium_carterae.2
MSRASNVELKRLARYLKAAPRCTLRYPKQSVAEAAVVAYVDSDWAGDPVTRRSTTGMLLLHSSTVQAVIGLSSAG